MYNIPNLIKQPARCCTNCGKGYKQRSALDKHMLLCELITRTKKNTNNNSNKKETKETEEADEIIPTNKQMYHMLLELTTKYNKLSKKMEEVSKYAIKEKKKINILDWLNNNTPLTTSFKEFANSIPYLTLDTNTNTNTNTNKNHNDSPLIDIILNNSFNDILNEVFNQCTLENIPIVAFIQKPNALFIFNSNTSWIELTNDLFITFLISIQMKISKLLYGWKQSHKEELSSNEKLEELANKALIKIMTPEFKQERYYTKAKTLLYNKIKKDIKMLIEYEFEF